MANTRTLLSGQSAGGVSAAGTALDTVNTVRGNQNKIVETIIWSYGANGSPMLPPGGAPYYGRLLVIDGLDGANIANPIANGVGSDAGPGGIVAYGGLIKFDLDLLIAPSGPNFGQFTFPSTDEEGALMSTSGPLSVLLCAARNAGGALAAGIIGKLTVVYKEVSQATLDRAAQRTYDYTARSGPIR